MFNVWGMCLFEFLLFFRQSAVEEKARRTTRFLERREYEVARILDTFYK